MALTSLKLRQPSPYTPLQKESSYRPEPATVVGVIKRQGEGRCERSEFYFPRPEAKRSAFGKLLNRPTYFHNNWYRLPGNIILNFRQQPEVIAIPKLNKVAGYLKLPRSKLLYLNIHNLSHRPKCAFKDRHPGA